MSRLLPRAAASSGALAVALLLVSPTAAYAGDHGRAGGHNPPGNNGTIKIDEPAPADSGHANRPHPGCAFQLRMFGFDDDQYGTVTFTGQAPTKTGTLLTQSHVLLSDDAAGGGQDADAVYSYTAQQLGLTGTPTAKQGWHVKVAVDADNAPGGAKKKVFWLDCAAPAPTTTQTTPTGTTAQGGATSGAATTQSRSETTSTRHSLRTLSATTAGAASAPERVATAVEGFTGGNATAAAATTHATAGTRGLGSGLPFTGFALSTLLTLALGALAAGALAVRAGRRRTSEL